MTLLSRIGRIVRANLNAAWDPVVAELQGARARSQQRPEADAPGSHRPGAPAPPQDCALAGYYANLEVPYGSDLPTVRTAWRRMMRAYHPDRHGADPEKRRVANELTAELTRAYRELEKALKDGRLGRR
ncbi:MAG: J domain-containing protein [Candidatus Latescibacterota bacterium]